MPFTFPTVEDRPLGNPPLREVVCQVRFERILRISSQEPTELQEEIRQRFPVFAVDHRLRVEKENSGAFELTHEPRIYRFRDADRRKMFSLSESFFALSTEDYEDWPAFADALKYVFDALQRVYSIPYATRIGLRYINFIDRSFASSDDIQDIFDLVRPELTSMLRADVVAPPAQSMAQIRTVQGGEDQFTLRYGLATKGDPPEVGFILDFDHYAQRTEGELSLDDLIERCEEYHDFIYSAFRWCVQDGFSVFDPKEEDK